MFRCTQFVVCFCLTICFGLSLVTAQQWADYRGPNGDGTATTEANLEGELQVDWKVPTENGFSSFAVADGKALTLVARGKREVCIALDAETGNEIWAHNLGQEKYDGGGGAGAVGNKGGDGPRSTPTISDGHVYVYDAQLKLYCLELETGKPVWSQDILNDFQGINIRWQNATSPVADEGRVFVGGGGAGRSMLAFDKKSGKLVWKQGNEKMTHATPIMATIDGKQQIIFFMQSGMIAMEPETGKQIWRNQFNYSVSTASSPVVFDEFVYGSAGYNVGAKLFKVSGSQSEMVWEKPNRLINHWSTPVYYKGHLYGMFSFKKYGRGPLQCIDPMTGEIKWSENGFGPGNCIIVNDKIVALSDDGHLVIASASPDGYTELSRNQVLDGKCWSMPAVDGGKIYLRSTTHGTRVSFK